MRFSQGSIPESLVKKKSQPNIQRLLKQATSIEYKKNMVSTNVEYHCERKISLDFQGLILVKNALIY